MAIWAPIEEDSFHGSLLRILRLTSFIALMYSSFLEDEFVRENHFIVVDLLYFSALMYSHIFTCTSHIGKTHVTVQVKHLGLS